MKLIEQGADVNERDVEGNTPLMLAVIKELSPVQIELMRCGADLHAIDRSGRTPLMLAMDNGSYNCVDEFIWQYEQIGEKPQIDFAYDQGRLALLFAIYTNDENALRGLLNEGADPNCSNKQGLTPLMLAVECGNPGGAAILLDNGADVHAVYVKRGHQTALHLAAYGSMKECVRLLLAHGAAVDARDDWQSTPLIYAARVRFEVVNLLLENGADIHAEDIRGRSVLVEAGWGGNEATIRTLLEWGAGSHSKHLHDAFYAAFSENNHDKAPLFIEGGMPVGLCEAVMLEDKVWIEKLLIDGVGQNEINRALATAAKYASPEIVRLLMEQGADANPSLALGQTNYNFKHSDKIREALLQAGTNE